MPRPGQGSSRSSRPSSSHSSSSRASSGHRMNSSSSRPGQRPSSSSGYGFNGSSGNRNTYDQRGRYYGPSYRQPRSSGTSPLFPLLLGSMMGRSSRRRDSRYDPPYNMNPNSVPPGYNPPPRRSSSLGKILMTVLIVIVLVFVFGSCFGCSSSSGSAPSNTGNNTAIGVSTTNRKRLETGQSYQSDDIVDDLGWFDNIAQTEKRLKSFYDKTGVQPYIVLNAYDSNLKTDQQKAQYAQDFYEQHINNEDTFLYMYFAESDPDETGYMEAVRGRNIGSVMDQEATDIFWNYLDQNWTSDMSTDDLFVTTFNQTADRIMTKTTTTNDVMNKGLIVLAVIIAGAIIIGILMLRRKHERERAQETKEILETPIDASMPEDEDLLKKYGQDNDRKGD